MSKIIKSCLIISSFLFFSSLASGEEVAVDQTNPAASIQEEVEVIQVDSASSTIEAVEVTQVETVASIQEEVEVVAEPKKKSTKKVRKNKPLKISRNNTQRNKAAAVKVVNNNAVEENAIDQTKDNN